MAFTVNIAGAASMKIDESANYTATATGAAVEGTVTYVWTIDGASNPESTNVLRYTAAAPAGKKTLKVVATSTPADGEPEVAEDTFEITVNNKTMSVTLTLSPASVTQEIGASQVVTANLAGAPSGYSNTYVWKRNTNAIVGETSSTITITGDAEASYTLNCEVTTTAPNYDTVTSTKSAVITITKKAMTGVSVSLTPASINAPEGTAASFKADVVGAPSGASGVYSWKKDGSPVEGSTSTLEIDTSTEGSQVIEVSVVVSAANYNPVTVTKTGNVTITAKVAPVPDGELPYVHPLPVRNSAYIWCGWWVMDEIQKMALAGQDWKTDAPDSPYYLHRYTLQKMITDYPEVDVQESRNGRIIHRTALEAGIIYDYVY